MTRYTDYQVDYQTGELLFKQPVPAVDVYGNPVFITVLAETDNGGPASALWGLRTTLDARALLGGAALDSLRLGGTWVHESPGAGDHQLLGTDLHIARAGRLSLGAETSWSQSPDSSGFAASADGALALFTGARVTASWMSVGRGFDNPSNIALIGGTEQLKLSAEFRNGTRQIKFSHEWEHFDILATDRQFTSATITQPVSSTVQVEVSAISDQLTGGSASTMSQDGELRIRWKPDPRWTLTAEGRHQFELEGANLQPDYVGADAAFAVNRDVSLDLRERMVFLPGDSAAYSVTDIGVKSRIGFGTRCDGVVPAGRRVRGAERRADRPAQQPAPRPGVGRQCDASERRVGIDRASTLDPVRALPFAQVEEDYWSVGVGAEYLKPHSPYRLTARAEYRDGTIESTGSGSLAGDVSLEPLAGDIVGESMVRTHRSPPASSPTRTGTRRSGTRLSALFSTVTPSTSWGSTSISNAADPNGGVLASSGDEGRRSSPARRSGSHAPAPSSPCGTPAFHGRHLTASDTRASNAFLRRFVGRRFGIRIHPPAFELRTEAPSWPTAPAPPSAPTSLRSWCTAATHAGDRGGYRVGDLQRSRFRRQRRPGLVRDLRRPPDRGLAHLGGRLLAPAPDRTAGMNRATRCAGRTLLPLLAIVMSAFRPAAVRAQATGTWTGAVSNRWSNAGNWSGSAASRWRPATIWSFRPVPQTSRPPTT